MASIKIRNNKGDWEGLPTLGVQEFPANPKDGYTYGRKDDQWVRVDKSQIHVSSVAPTDAEGQDGDVWIQYTV